MKLCSGFCVFLSLWVFGVPAPAQEDVGRWVPLFNGQDLSGWVLVNTPPETWSIKDGMLICSGKPIGEIRTDRMYQNFELELEWRHMKPRGNAGVFVWADDITSRGVPFHRGIEVQVLENAYGNTRSHTTHGDIFPIHGATMTPINGRGGQRAFPTEERSNPSPQWNHYRIVCNDGDISLAVNGKVVTRGTDASPRKGYICLESEGGIVHYRNIRIKELPETPVADEHIAVANRNYRSIYSGLDLNGWGTSSPAAGSWQPKDWILAFDGQVTQGDSRLESQETWDLSGFVFDFRFSEQSQRLCFHLGSQDSPSLTIDAIDDARVGDMLEKTGRWNRVEGRREGDVWTLSINGKPHLIESPAASPMRIAFTAGGPVDLANLYIREAE